MSIEAQLLIEKFRQMDAELNFLANVWSRLDQTTRDRMINDYAGRVPARFNR